MTPEESLLRLGDTCWRAAMADRAAVLMDNGPYYAALAAALPKAERSISILGWTFDPRTVLEPDARGQPASEEGRIGRLLVSLAEARPELDVRVLCWQMDLPIAATQAFYPHRARGFFKNTPVQFRLEKALPLGACHHQKVVIIDDKVAFSGGCDISVDRWDSVEHPDHDGHRIMPNGKQHPPRHDVMAVVSGRAARVLGDLFRRRWLLAADEEIPPPPPTEGDAWPAHVAPEFHKVRVGVSRTEPAWGGDPGVNESERLHLAAIAAAKQTLIFENQYVASPVIETALARRLQDLDGPEIIIITTRKSPSWFDQMTMDRTRAAMIGRLRAFDVYGRFRAFCPVTESGRGIIVHSKVTIVDDRQIRIGSANLNNRSFGFDTECDVVIEADDEAERRVVAAYRLKMLSHWLGVDESAFEREDELGGPGMIEALDRLSVKTGRLIPVEGYRQSWVRNMIALNHLGDPVDPTDSWQPWVRFRKLSRRTRSLLGGANPAGRSRR